MCEGVPQIAHLLGLQRPFGEVVTDRVAFFEHVGIDAVDEGEHVAELLVGQGVLVEGEAGLLLQLSHEVGDQEIESRV